MTHEKVQIRIWTFLFQLGNGETQFYFSAEMVLHRRHNN